MTASKACRFMLLCLLAACCVCLGALGQVDAVTIPSSGGAASGSGGLMLRVVLDTGVPVASFRVTQGNYTLSDGSTGLLLGSAGIGDTWTVTAAGTTMLAQGPGLNSPQPFQGPVVLQEAGGGWDSDHPNLFFYNGVLYRGSLAVQNLSGKLLVLDVLDMESYLFGVVGKEIGGSASPEAFCAQAVASRSYALSMRGVSAWYDVGHDSGSQVYGGYSGEQVFASSGGNPVVDAVRRTSGQVLEYKGTLVKAFFHANAGGCTEDVENVWTDSTPYLRGVPSDGDAYADTLGGSPQSTYRWTKTISRSGLESQLGVGKIQDIQVSRNRTRISTDPATGSIKRDFVPGTETVSGRATQVAVIGTGGTKTFYRDSIRQAFGLKSTLFDLDFGGQLEGLDAQGQTEALTGDEVYVEGQDGVPLAASLKPGSLYIIGSGNRLVTQGNSTDNVTFNGRGYGHGVGMSQWGAIGLAVKGYNYQDILELYYNQGKHDGNLVIAGNYGN